MASRVGRRVARSHGLFARVFARLARTFPDADGPYAYMRTTLGEWPAFIALWQSDGQILSRQNPTIRT